MTEVQLAEQRERLPPFKKFAYLASTIGINVMSVFSVQ